MAKRKQTSEQQFRFPRQVGDETIEHGCGWNDHGDVCPAYGFLSQSTNGSGPWYCRQHFARIMGWPQLEAMSIEKARSIAVEEIAAGLRPQYRDRAFASLKAKA